MSADAFDLAREAVRQKIQVTDLSGPEIRYLNFILLAANRKRFISGGNLDHWCGEEKIAADLRMPARTLSYARAKLREAGITIETRRRGNRRTTVERINPAWYLDAFWPVGPAPQPQDVAATDPQDVAARPDPPTRKILRLADPQEVAARPRPARSCGTEPYEESFFLSFESPVIKEEPYEGGTTRAHDARATPEAQASLSPRFKKPDEGHRGRPSGSGQRGKSLKQRMVDLAKQQGITPQQLQQAAHAMGGRR